MENIIDVPQRFFSVSEFQEVMSTLHITEQYHEQTAGKYSYAGDDYQSDLSYRILGDDMVLWFDEMTYHVTHRSPIKSNSKDKYYLFGYVLQENRPIIVEQNGSRIPLHKDLVMFCNNFAEITAWFPKGYSGTNLQVIVSHSFITEYINPISLRDPALQHIIYGEDPTFFAMPRASAPLRRNIMQLYQKLQQHPSEPLAKLRIFQKMGTIFDLFFRMHLGSLQENTRAQNHSFSPVQQVGNYLEMMTHVPFPGLEFLAWKYNLSVSGLKRGFKAEFGTTPLKYYRGKQVKQACRKLQHTRLSVAEIAAEFGFDSPGNFIRAFRAETGTTPGRFRKQKQ